MRPFLTDIHGTFALIKISEKEYELGKMAVDKNQRNYYN